MVSAKEAIAFAELSVYCSCMIPALYINFRHTPSRQFGWFYLALFVAIRIASAATEIFSARDPRNITKFIWAAILSVAGLSPLLLACLGLLKRA